MLLEDHPARHLIKRLGFQLVTSNQEQVIVDRHRWRFAIDDDPDTSYRAFAWSLWACRLVTDRLGSTYDVTTEGTQNAAPRNIYEVPSPHGDRERLLLPTVIAHAFESMTGERLVQTPWVDDRFVVVYSLEEGLGTHLLTHTDLDNYPFTLEEMTTRARLAHFYASYKMKTIHKLKHETFGVVKIYGSSEGRTGARAILFPEYDWDAAQDNGVMFCPSRDILIVGEPFEAIYADPMLWLTTSALFAFHASSDATPDVYVADAKSHLEASGLLHDSLDPSFVHDIEQVIASCAFKDRERRWLLDLPFYLDAYRLTTDRVLVPPQRDPLPQLSACLIESRPR